MEQIILVVYVLLSAGIVGLILLQQGKGADMGASFGSGASQTVFGSAGSGNVLTRATAILAALFFIASVGLAMMAKDKADVARKGDIIVPAVLQSPAAEQAGTALPDNASAAPNERGEDVPTVDESVPVGAASPGSAAEDVPVPN